MAIALALMCAVVYGVADYSGGRAARAAPSMVVSFLSQLTGVAIALPAVLVIGTALPAGRDAAWGALAGGASALALACFYHALAGGAMTVVAPVTAVTSAVIPVVVGLATGERPGAVAIFGMVVALIAVALVSGAVGNRSGKTPPSIIGFAFVAGLGFAVIFVALGQTSDESGIWPLAIARIVSVTMIAIVLVSTRTSVSGRGRTWRLAVFAGVLDISANFLYLMAVQRGLLSVVVVVAALYPVSTVCLAFGLDKERVSRSQAIGMGLAVGALVLVSVSGSG